MTSTLLPDPSEIEGAVPVPVAPGVAVIDDPAAIDALAPQSNGAAAEPGTVTRRLVSGTSALGLGVVIERGSGFVANILAARLGGASTFGAYSLAITTANNIATYAGAGIGSTAARFSGKYQYGSSNYGTLARALAVVSVVSAAVAALGLWLGAGPIARFLDHRDLVRLLQWAALSAAGMIVLECARGFFVGQRRLAALVLMSVLVGAGMLSLLPLAAFHHSPVRMVASQGAITMTAVVVCVLLAAPLGLLSSFTGRSERRFGAMLREVWGFGLVQLLGLVGANAAGWWLTALVARSDRSLIQMSFFGIASQLRNIVGFAPALLTEGSFAVMAEPEGEITHTPRYVLGWTTFASSLVAFLLASVGILLAPWMLRLLYSSTYSHAAVTVAVALALAVIHMGNGPAAARLSILSIRTTGVINAVWAVSVAVAAALLMSRGCGAATAMSVYLAAHMLAAGLVLLALAQRDALPEGMTAVFAIAACSTVALAAMAAWRAAHPRSIWSITGLMLVLLLAALGALLAVGRRRRWIPSRAAVARLTTYLKRSITQALRRPSHAA